jgi:DNA repair photolyase
MIQEIVCETAIDYEHPPDGAKLPVIDAYDGCQLRCPYCFQWRDKSWNQSILVKTNLPDALSRDLDQRDLAQPLYVGSRGDPYQPLEERYRLTRKTLEVLLSHQVPCFVSTKADPKTYLQDADLFIRYGYKLTICVGQANLGHLQRNQDQRALPNILAANQLAAMGVNTWAFITPVLPGITDVETLIDALDDSIPVYLDGLRLDPGSSGERRFFGFLTAAYPELEPRYRALVAKGTDPYYDRLRKEYGTDPRISFVFD